MRALAPFIAGASRMELRRFLPYDIVGAGLWSALFCLLGYFFWQSLGTVEKYIGRGAAAFTGLVAIVLAIWLRGAAAARPRDARAGAAAARRQPAVAARARPAHLRLAASAPAGSGSSSTTLLALASVGLFTYFWLASLLGTSQLASLDDEPSRSLDALYMPVVGDIVSVAHAPRLAAGDRARRPARTAGWAIRTRRATREGVALVARYAVTCAVVHIGKAATDRPRPSDPHASAEGLRTPRATAPTPSRSWRARSCSPAAATGWPTRFALVGIAIALAAAIAASRVYLRVHYLSDVIGGLAIGTAIFSLAGIVALVVGALRHNGGR